MNLALANEQGALIKLIPASLLQDGATTFGFHRVFGWISESGSKARLAQRRRNGLRDQSETSPWIYRFEIAQAKKGVSVRGLERCEALQNSNSNWTLVTEQGQFQIFPHSGESLALSPLSSSGVQVESGDQSLKKGFLASILLALIFFALLWMTGGVSPVVEAPQIMEPISVKIVPEKQRAVSVPTVEAIPQQIINNQQVRRAVAQNLGFLGMLGNNKLSKALGGVRTQLKDASDGAGAGGKGGSGGELLVGLGQGVKRTTVGNSGVAGLGGVGTKGAGGGNGGYGNTLVGSGEGKSLSAMAVSRDMVLEGGLDRAVIQATIAKYLSQVRACYEQGLATQPGMNGTVTMAFEVGVEGALNFARVQKSTLGSSQVESCISQKMLGWKFPKPLGGVNVKVAYPFLLRPIS